MVDRSGPGILSGSIDDWRSRDVKKIEAVPGMKVTHLGSRFSGTVAGFDEGGVILRSPNSGLERHFALHSGSFLVAGQQVTLLAPRSVGAKAAVRQRTASGSIALKNTSARVARASRILVEGVHDAELVEKVWGDDLRVDGIVVERLDGIDLLEQVIQDFRPGADARLGVLVDHLVPGSKESRIASALAGPHVMVCGTPFIDVWQAIRPAAAGIDRWPSIPRGQSWKEGICQALGEPSPGRLWKRLFSQVRSYADLEPSLVGAVESLIDFVTAVE